MPQEPIVYINGEFLPAAQACVSLGDWGLHGVAATEITRTFRQRCFRLDDHLDRLNASMTALGLSVDLLRDEWQSATQQIVEHHAELIGASEELLINHLVTAGLNPAYGAEIDANQPTVVIQSFPLRSQRWAEKYRLGQHLVVPEIRQIPPQCLNPQIKSRNRLHWYLADRKAGAIAEGAQALLLDLQGHITETSVGNFYVICEGGIITPRATNTLPGVSRMVLKEIARYLDLSYTEADLNIDDAQRAEEAFTTSTGYCVLPVTKLNGQTIGAGTPGPQYQRILETWSMMVGVDIASQAAATVEVSASTADGPSQD